MRVALATLGCRLNQFETAAMRARLARAGYDPEVTWDESADVFVLNSCTVTAEAEAKGRALVRAARRRAPDARIVVVGCAPQRDPPAWLALPEVDAVLGNEEKKRLDEFLPRIERGGRALWVEPYPSQLPMAAEWVEGPAGSSRPVLKVQEGCDLRCAFCAVQQARGPSRSRPPRAVVDQARRLAAGGSRELVLAGVQLGSYGRDLRPALTLVDLLELLLEALPPQVHLRLSSLDPHEVDGRLLALFAAQPRICPYLHLALQSGSDAVLRSMRRRYRAAEAAALVQQAAAGRPGAGIGADVLVGFPGEGPGAFHQTVTLLESLPITFYHVFRYSPRAGTEAAARAGHVPAAEIAQRARHVLALGRTRREEFLRRHLGRTAEGIVEQGMDPQGRCAILLDDYATVWARAAASLRRQRVRVQAARLDPRGRLVGHVVDAGQGRERPDRRRAR